MPVFKEVCEKLSQTYPDLFVVIPSVKTVAPTVCDMVKRWHIPHTVIMGEKKRYDAFAASDVAIAASGTVSLELSLAGVPHLIAYRVHPITGWMAKKLLKIRFVNLINLLQNKEVIPELLQDNCTVEKIYQQTQKLLQNPKQNVKKSLDKLKTDVLPSDKMADVLLSFMKRNKNDK
jgi:lipid-A-disaccharide synthase